MNLMGLYNFLFFALFLGGQEILCQERKFVHTREELALTALISEEINVPVCKNNDIAFVVHSAAQSSGRYFDKRQAARQTWVTDAQKLNISVIFALALPRNESIQAELIKEQNEYKDMVQFNGFIDDYWNLTLKAVAVTNWVSKYCSNVQLIAKLDDDIFVNVERLEKTKYQIENGITGHIYGYQTTPDRDPESRYYMPEWAYPDPWYPKFVSGLFYIMTKDIIYPLNKAAPNWTEIVVDFDDLYMTGIIGERINLDRHRSEEVVYRENKDPNCGITDVTDLNKMIAYHGCDTAEYSINLYKAWKTSQIPIIQNDTNGSPSIIFCGKILSLVFLVLSYTSTVLDF